MFDVCYWIFTDLLTIKSLQTKYKNFPKKNNQSLIIQQDNRKFLIIRFV